MRLDPRLAYSLLSFLAGIYVLALIALIMCSVGDTDRIFDLQFWFAWQAAFLVIMMADSNPHDIHLYNVAQGWVIVARFVACVLAAGQTLGFMIWAAIEWAQRGSSAPLFMSVAVFILAAQFCVGVLMALVSTMAVYMPRPFVMFMHNGDRRNTAALAPSAQGLPGPVVSRRYTKPGGAAGVFTSDLLSAPEGLEGFEQEQEQEGEPSF
jgi:hypothetical protein